jgi:glycosyltransferase involved in cell wall biosynthesis
MARGHSVSVVLVDWLGRGGIAQTSEAWVSELDASGQEVCVVTRANRELGDSYRASDRVDLVEASRPQAIAAHRAVVAAAAETVRERAPSCVVVQNYIVPALEEALYRAAREIGSRVVVVMHDDRPHSLRSGTQVGLPGMLRRADVVVAHTAYVGDAVARRARRTVEQLPQPMQVGMLTRSGGVAAVSPGDELLALHFGTLRRRYKGSDVVARLTGRVPGWTFGAVGNGAPGSRPGLECVPGWIASPDLVATVAVADAAILPYRRATQSGAIVLAQALGVVPVATAVGGVPEQIDHDRDGVLVPRGARSDVWRAALEALRDDEHRKELATAGRARVELAHEQFARAVPALVT